MKTYTPSYYSTYTAPTYSPPSSATSPKLSPTKSVDKCPEGYSWYVSSCVKTLDNAKYNGSSYSCNSGYFANAAGTQCVGIDTYCKEKHGIRARGENGQCVCNAGAILNSATNKCVVN